MTTTSPKLTGSSIVWCPEVEQAEPCKWFGAGMCPGCFAEKLWRVRRARWSGKGFTEKRGLVRLGTYIEPTEAHYEKFKALFPTRHFFVISRGLEPEGFYLRLAADPYCLNVQVSVDILVTEVGAAPRIIPGEERLRWFVENVPKALFRFKTLDHEGRDKWFTKKTYLPNVDEFTALAERVAIPRGRIMETPLRLRAHVPHQKTPLEAAGWSTKEYFRCNSPCSSCRAENGVLACAVTPKLVEIVASLQPAAPRRASEEDVRRVEEAGRIDWAGAVTEAFERLGPAKTKDVYRCVEEVHPEVAVLMHWKVRVRENIQRMARRREDGTWEMIPREAKGGKTAEDEKAKAEGAVALAGVV